MVTAAYGKRLFTGRSRAALITPEGTPRQSEAEQSASTEGVRHHVWSVGQMVVYTLQSSARPVVVR
jgi:hypothetical protein